MTADPAPTPRLAANFQLLPELAAPEERVRLALPCPHCKAPTGTPCKLGRPRRHPNAIQEHARRFDRVRDQVLNTRIAIEDDLLTVSDCLERGCYACAQWVTDHLAPLARLCPAVETSVAAALAGPGPSRCTSPAKRSIKAPGLARFVAYLRGQEPAHITQADLDAVLDKHPHLNDNGYGRPRGYDYDTDAGHKRLRGLLDQVQHCAAYLRSQPWQTRLTARSMSSYGLKHAAERWGEFGYVCNGAMIAAALILGVPIKLDGLNPQIGVTRARS